VFRRREIYDLLDKGSGIIRPANYPASNPGTGVYVYDSLRCRIAVVNLMGTAMLEPLRNPFDTIDEILKTLDTKLVLLDFHAEATSEKRAMGFYLDGRVSAVVGTHTHVQTADEQILPNQTAYLTDLGMCGPHQSVLGVKPEAVIRRFRTSLPTRFENADGPACVCGAAISIDEKTGHALSIERFFRVIQ
jgi:metallophosphoesterase (TIGR00282 family)